MSALASTASAAAPSQMLAIRARVQQARQQADQAEANARSLRAQADDAERGVQRARQNVRHVEKLSATSGSASAPPASAAPAQVETPVDPRSKADVYGSALASTFSIAKPVMEIDLSPPAKNLVLSSIFVATDQFLARHEASAAAPPSPASGSPAPVRNLFGQATGSLVNTSA